MPELTQPQVHLYTPPIRDPTGWGLRTGVTTADPSAQALPASYAGYFTGSGTGTAPSLLYRLQSSLLPAPSTGVTTSTLTGTVTGVPGGTLTGTATLTGTSSFGQTTQFHRHRQHRSLGGVDLYVWRR